MLDVEDVDPGEARLGGVTAHEVGSHDRAGAGAAMLQAHRQAVEGAEGVEESLHLAGRRSEGVLGALVGDEHDALRACELLHRAQDPHRIRHVVEHLDREDEVVVTHDRGVGRVSHHEPHAVGHTGIGGVLACRGDRVLVEVVAVDGGIQVDPGDRDRRQPLATANLGDAHRFGGRELCVHFG